MNKPTSHLKQKVTLPQQNKRRWWLWGCGGCFILIILIVGGFVGLIWYGDYIEENKFGLEIKDEQLYSIMQKYTLLNEGPIKSDKIEAALALIRDIDPNQQVISRTITPDNYELVTDESGNEFAKFVFENIGAGETVQVFANYEVDIKAFKNYYKDCQGDIIETHLEAEENIESDDERIINLAQEIVASQATVCDQAKAIYDYVGDNMIYPGPMEGGGALNALETMEGDCVYFADLFVALSRAAGIPARTLNGITYKEESSESEELDNEDKNQDLLHAWSEVYLPGIGWTPVDATWGQREGNRDKHFSQTDGKHIIIDYGRNIQTLENSTYFFYRYWWTGDKINISMEEDVQINPMAEGVTEDS